MPAPPQANPLARLGRFAVRRRRAVVLTWLAVLVAAVGVGPQLAGDWAVDYATPGSDSKAVAETMGREFPEASADSLLVVWSSPQGAKSSSAQGRIERVLAQVDRIDGIGAPQLDRAQYAADGRTALLEVPLEGRAAAVALDHGPQILAAAKGASDGETTIHFGGLVMQQSEVGEISSEGVGLMFALLILLATFGTLVAAGLPIATALFGIGTGAAVVGALAAVVDTPDWAESVAAMVGIGVGIDYALLILTRHRTLLQAGASVEDAVAGALTSAGRSVLVAGGTVVISLMGLLLMSLPYLVGVAFAASSSVLIVMVASLTLLPALLGFAGHRIDALRVGLPGGKARRARRQAALPPRPAGMPADASPRFARWSRSVQRRPWTAVAVGLVITGLFAAPLAGVRVGFPGPQNEPVGSQARLSNDLLVAAFGAGVATPIRILAPVREGGTQDRVEGIAQELADDPRVAAVQPQVTSADGRYVLLAVQSRTSADTAESDRLVEHIRDEVVPAAGVPGTLVGGLTAETHDQAYATESRLPLLFLGVAGLSALLLLAAFRSVLIPLKAAAMNLLSVAAAYGVVALVAEGGTVGQLFGLTGEVPIPPFIPVLMFAVLFGLSMDYEVFLLGRIRELYLEHGSTSRAVSHGLAATARVITAAAAIMIAVFGAFALSDQVFLKLIGIGMASAILIDATVIRLLLVPALMSLLDDRNWWMPGWLDRLVPGVRLEAAPAPEPGGEAASADGPAAGAGEDAGAADERRPEPVAS